MLLRLQETGTPARLVRDLVRPARLMPGDWVQVKDEAEIRATLDGEGAVGHLPFMPEMRAFIGRRFRVKARADRTVTDRRGLRSLTDTVHLEGATCGGEAHDGCGRKCLLFWKEAWLTRLSGDEAVRPSTTPPASEPPASEPPAAKPEPAPFPLPVKDGDGYLCQATRLYQASQRLSPYAVVQHISALWNEDLPAIDLARGYAVVARDAIQRRLRRGKPWSVVPGTCVGPTPTSILNLVAGELVRVKTRPEILATLDGNGNNRGLEFSREMLAFCGREARVLRRCDRLIRDDPPTMARMKNTVILADLTYAAYSCLSVPRAEYFFWHECWLERTEPTAAR